MTFYFYANYPTKWVTIHRGNCGHCREGEGVQTLIHEDHNGFWSRAYYTYTDAQTDATSTAARKSLTVRNCGRCRPS